jgi:hypothetical protein
MSSPPGQEPRIMPREFIFNPLHHGDPFYMEYVLDRLDPEQSGPLLASGLRTMAAVYDALAKGAADAAQIIAGQGG